MIKDWYYICKLYKPWTGFVIVSVESISSKTTCTFIYRKYANSLTSKYCFYRTQSMDFFSDQHCMPIFHLWDARWAKSGASPINFWQVQCANGGQTMQWWIPQGKSGNSSSNWFKLVQTGLNWFKIFLNSCWTRAQNPFT